MKKIVRLVIVQNVHLCQLPDSNPNSESDLDSNSSSDTSCLVSDMHVTKIRIREPFEEATKRFKESVVSLKRHIYSKNIPKSSL